MGLREIESKSESICCAQKLDIEVYLSEACNVTKAVSRAVRGSRVIKVKVFYLLKMRPVAIAFVPLVEAHLHRGGVHRQIKART